MFAPMSAAKWQITQNFRKDAYRIPGDGFNKDVTMAVGALGFGIEKSVTELDAAKQKMEAVLAERKALAFSLGVPLSQVKVCSMEIKTTAEAKTSVAALTSA
mmetsp:Transcript_69722/g.216462  ORF Transcript_69722/g.216462 Transcript_69722/m.216462 type:complete len:102 (-) Transcript_69722:85-390(-)